MYIYGQTMLVINNMIHMPMYIVTGSHNIINAYSYVDSGVKIIQVLLCRSGIV